MQPAYEFGWNHTTLQALKVDKSWTYLQVAYPQPFNPDLVLKQMERYGEEIYWHHEMARMGGNVQIFALPLVKSRGRQEMYKLIHELETVINKIRQQNKKLPCGFFTHRDQSLISIYDFIKWSKTSYGGKQYKLFDTDEPSCVNWGLCDYRGKNDS